MEFILLGSGLAKKEVYVESLETKVVHASMLWTYLILTPSKPLIYIENSYNLKVRG